MFLKVLYFEKFFSKKWFFVIGGGNGIICKFLCSEYGEDGIKLDVISLELNRII